MDQAEKTEATLSAEEKSFTDFIKGWEIPCADISGDLTAPHRCSICGRPSYSLQTWIHALNWCEDCRSSRVTDPKECMQVLYTAYTGFDSLFGVNFRYPALRMLHSPMRNIKSYFSLLKVRDPSSGSLALHVMSEIPRPLLEETYVWYFAKRFVDSHPEIFLRFRKATVQNEGDSAGVKDDVGASEFAQLNRTGFWAGEKFIPVSLEDCINPSSSIKKLVILYLNSVGRPEQAHQVELAQKQEAVRVAEVDSHATFQESDSSQSQSKPI